MIFMINNINFQMQLNTYVQLSSLYASYLYGKVILHFDGCYFSEGFDLSYLFFLCYKQLHKNLCWSKSSIGVSAIIICFHMLREEALSYSDDMVAKDPEDVANMPT